ncbi:MAG TPA: retroviral-like aspartic protease family protein [Phycisphaerae bacterium]|nr:retroviral-like aspartic protease family protein [Phycisphaerae bacterium]
MITSQGQPMGRFYVDVALANYDDCVAVRQGTLAPEAVRRMTVSGMVDTGATRLVLPEHVVEQLGLQRSDRVKVRYADGRTVERNMATSIHLTYAGRTSLMSAVVEPGRDSALIGAIVLEELDLIVDCTTQTLVPRDPEHIIAEIE